MRLGKRTKAEVHRLARRRKGRIGLGVLAIGAVLVGIFVAKRK